MAIIKRTSVSLALALTSLSVATPTFALQGISIANVEFSSTGDFSIGYQFQVGASDISIDGLGFIDDGRNGLQIAHAVGLWTDTGSLLSQVTVASGITDPLIGFFRYGAITPVNLTSGQIYRVAGSFQSPGENYGVFPTGLTVDSAITLLNEADVFGSSLAFPTSLSPFSSKPVIGSNIRFTTAAPVPFEFSPVLGLGIIGGLVAAKKLSSKFLKK